MILGIGKDFISKHCRLGIISVLQVFALLILTSSVHADVERIVEYEYDGAGNIVRIFTQEQSALPVVSPLDPEFINIGRTITVTATGSSLLGVDITTDVTGLTINAISSTSSDLTFELTASDQATPGDAIIKFSTGLGEVEQTIFVAETPPTLTTNPSPIAIEDDNATTIVSLIFSVPRPEDETYTISTTDVAIADVTAGSFTILAGQTLVDISLTGVSAGATSLDVLLAGKFYTYTFAVYVGKTYPQLTEDFPDMLERNLFANSVGVVLQEDRPFPSNAIHASPVGIMVDDFSPFSASPVGVFVGNGSSQNLFSPVVGVALADINNFAFAPVVGTILGPLADDLNIPALSLDSTTNIDITGVNLNEVLTVSIVPNTDLIINGSTIDGTGTLLTIDLTIGPGAVVGSYEIVLEDANGAISTRSGAALMFDIQ